MGFLVTQLVRNSPAMWETWEDLLEKGTAPHSSILAWRIPRTEEPGRLVHGVKESHTTEQLSLSQISKWKKKSNR